MGSSYYKLNILERTLTRTKAAKVLRREGFIPGVLYYAGAENVKFSIDKLVLYHALQSGERIYEIDHDGDVQFTMIKELQYHPVTDEIIHIDLMRVRRSEKITISIPLVLIGEAIGIKEGGILSQALNQVEISCFPTDVPETIELNIDDLELNASKSVADISINNEDIEILSSSDLNVASIHPPAVEEEPDDELDEEETEEETEGETEDSKEGSGDDSKES